MSDQDNENLEGLDEVISPDDVVEIIELDDNGGKDWLQ